VLFAAFGVNIESITIVVSLFMFGLGLGSLAGGLLARRFPRRAPELFLACELTIGCFGLVSIPLIEAVSRVTLHGSLLTVSLTVFGLLVLPTMLMGATLPILVSHLYRYYRNVGKSVGILYCINTVGSAIACFITADVLFAVLGEQASVIVAAACNFVVGVLVLRYARRLEREGAGAVGPVEG
jgi:predicted membrane-bound spermidine synthase